MSDEQEINVAGVKVKAGGKIGKMFMYGTAIVTVIGGLYGGFEVYKDYMEKYRDWKSHYYIKENVQGVEDVMRMIDWDRTDSPKYDTAGNPSISKNELIKAYIYAKTKR